MSAQSPVVNLFSSDGYELNVVNGVSTPANTRGLLVAGTDGTTTRFILMDGSSRQIVVGAGTAGTPAGGVVTVQGIASGTPLITGATYNSSGITLTDGSTGALQSDIKGNVKVTLATAISGEDTSNNVLATTFQPLATNTHAMTYVDGIAVTGVVAKAAPGNLYTIWGLNANASTRYIQIFNATSAPADGTAPLLAPIAVISGGTFSLDLAPYARYFSTGIYICNSTTIATKTLGSADMYITVGVG